MAFRERLQSLRKRKGVACKVVSELCGLASDSVRRYENGESEPTMHSLIALAEYFGVSVDYLVGKSDRP